MTNKKYELTDETIIIDGKTLHRIKALRSFGSVVKGELGGFVECEANLSQKRIDKVNEQEPSYQLIEISNNEFKSHFNMTEKDILGGEKTMYFILNKMQSVFDSYEGALKDDFTNFLNEHHNIFENIKENKKFYFEFNHPIILLVYFLVYKYRRKKDWHPFSYNIMENIYTYFGYSYEQD